MLSALILSACMIASRPDGGVGAAQEPHRMSPLDRAICAFYSGQRPASSLAKLGTPVIPDVVHALATGRIECSGTGRPLTHDEEDELVDVLATLGREPVLGHLRRETVLTADRRLCSATLHVLGALATPEDVGWMIRLATPEDASEPLDRELARDLRASLERLLEREPDGGIGALTGLLPAVRAGLVPEIARAAAARPSGKTIPFLVHCLSDTPEVDAIVLAHLGRVASSAPHPIDGHVVGTVRSLLFFGEPRVKREACLVLGHVEDYDSIPELIRSLADDDRGVRANARWALRAISGLDFGPEPARWNAWYEDQNAWWTERAPALLKDLRSSDPAAATHAINDLAARHFRRHGVAGELLVALSSTNDLVVAHACRALGQLRSEVAVEALVDCLGRDSEVVHQSAWSALCSITGRSLPPEREAWEVVLEGTR